MSDKPIKILTITTLFPNNKDPKHGIFIATRLRHLKEHYPNAEITVIAPVPRFPFSHERFGEYAKFSDVVEHENIAGFDVYHPKYLVLPKVGMYLAPKTMERAINGCLKKLLKQQSFDVIDGHYYFPDGIAIRNVAKRFNLPFTCTARGTDINLIPQYDKAKRMIQKVMADASHNMAVCQALADEMIAIGCDPKKTTVLRNGVDLDLFRPSDEIRQQALKAELGVTGRLIVSVGWLVERKGHHLIIEALKDIEDATLAIAGSGPDLKKLQNLCREFGVEDRVTFLGALPQPEINRYFQAADVSVLASSREGWANVLLEAMASGSPVVATKVWGTPEVVSTSSVGVLVERTAEDIGKGIKDVMANQLDRKAVRQYAEQFDWQSTSDGQIKIFESIIQ